MRKRSLHGGIHGVSQTSNTDTCRLVKHRRYKKGINEMLLYFKSQFEFVFINGWMKGCFSSYRSFIPDSSAWMRVSSPHGWVHGVSQTGNPDTCWFVKHRCYKNSINERLFYFKSQFVFVFINVWMKCCFSSCRSFIPDSSAHPCGWRSQQEVTDPTPWLLTGQQCYLVARHYVNHKQYDVYYDNVRTR